MSVDIARLVFEIDSTQAVTARKRIDAVTQAAKDLDKAARRLKTATEAAASGAATQENSNRKLARSATEMASAANQAATATDRAAAIAERAATRQALATERAAARELAAWNRIEAALAKRNASLRGDLALQRAGIDTGTRFTDVVKLQSHEMANLSAQIADVGVSLASGQAAWLVAIQQGSQIQGVLQGAAARGVGLGAALSQLGGVALRVLGTAGPIAIGAGAVGALAVAFLEARKEAADFANALAVTRGYAGLTADTFTEMAVRITAANDSAIGDTRALLNQAVASGKLQGETLEYAVLAAQKYAQLTGQNAADILASYEDMKSGVAKFGAEHALQYHDLTLAQLKHIEMLENEGRASEAQLELMKQIADGVGDLETNYGYLETALHAVKNAASEMWDKLLGVGREKTVGQQLDAARSKLSQLNSPYHNDLVKLGGAAGDAVQSDRKVAELRVGILEMLQSGQQRAAAEEAKRAKEEADAIRHHFFPTDRSKAKQAPRDTTEERNAEIAGLIAQAQQDELAARLSLATDATERARIERQIIDAGHAEKIADLDGRIAKIKDDKANTEAAEQIAALEKLKLTYSDIDDLKKQAVDRRRDQELARQAHAVRMGELDIQVDVLSSQADLLKSSYARDIVEQDILKLRQQQERLDLEETVLRGVLGGYSAEEVELAKRRLAVLGEIQANEMEIARQQTHLYDAIAEATDAVSSFKNAFSRGDWAGVLSSLQQTIQTVQAAFQTSSVAGLTTLGSVAASAVGGKTGSAIGGGLGIAALGSAASGALANATIGAAFSGAIGGTLANAGLALAGVLGPIGIIAGVAYALSGLLEGKPTNAGAGYDLITGQLSGNKRTSETEQAVTTAGDAILAGQSLLEEAGITLGATVRGLVIGTRDLSQIYLTNGETLTSAVGDAAAATETALLAVLDSATYADEQQKKLVESMRAAGKGFDDITAALETYASAQGLSKTFADAILAFTDPEGYAKSQLEAEQKTRRDQVQALYDELYLTAEQFASLNAQLDTLDGLELADTLSQFSSSLDDLISGAQSDLQSAYEAEAAVLNETISTYTQLLATLRDFDDSLKGQMASNASPLVAFRQSQGAFRSIAGSTDPSVLAGIPEAGQAYLQAALAIAPDKTTYARVLAEVRAGVADAEKYATDQIDTAEASLEQLKTMVGTLISIDKGVMTVAMAISNLGTLLAQQAVNDNATTTLPSWFSATQYLADNPDLARNYNSGGILSQYGSLEEAAIAHYLNTGQYEIAAGNRRYATGGSFTVGGGSYSGDRVPVNFMANTGEHVNVSRQDSVGRLAAAQERQNTLLAEQAAEMRKTREATERTERLWRRMSEGGTSLKTTAA